jgi:hypothetical protein
MSSHCHAKTAFSYQSVKKPDLFGSSKMEGKGFFGRTWPINFAPLVFASDFYYFNFFQAGRKYIVGQI